VFEVSPSPNDPFPLPSPYAFYVRFKTRPLATPKLLALPHPSMCCLAGPRAQRNHRLFPSQSRSTRYKPENLYLLPFFCGFFGLFYTSVRFFFPPSATRSSSSCSPPSPIGEIPTPWFAAVFMFPLLIYAPGSRAPPFTRPLFSPTFATKFSPCVQLALLFLCLASKICYNSISCLVLELISFCVAPPLDWIQPSFNLSLLFFFLPHFFVSDFLPPF